MGKISVIYHLYKTNSPVFKQSIQVTVRDKYQGIRDHFPIIITLIGYSRILTE